MYIWENSSFLTNILAECCYSTLLWKPHTQIEKCTTVRLIVSEQKCVKLIQ